MRLSADWMSIADDRILEFLHDAGPTTPTRMCENGRVRFSRQHINMRCKKLSAYGLLDELGNGVYAISEAGERYLGGDLDAADLESAVE
jgi:hypothetical protein